MHQSGPWHVRKQSATVELKKERENIYDESTKRNVEVKIVVYQLSFLQILFF